MRKGSWVSLKLAVSGQFEFPLFDQKTNPQETPVTSQFAPEPTSRSATKLTAMRTKLHRGCFGIEFATLRVERFVSWAARQRSNSIRICSSDRLICCRRPARTNWLVPPMDTSCYLFGPFFLFKREPAMD